MLVSKVDWAYTVCSFARILITVCLGRKFKIVPFLVGRFEFYRWTKHE